MSARQQCRPRPNSTRVQAFLGDESTTISRLPHALGAVADQRERLLNLIADQQKACRSYLAKAKPRLATLTFLNLAAGALAAAVAAGPALGGSSLLDTVQVRLDIGNDDLLYQVICAVAFVMSLISVITANIIRAYDFSARVAAVEGCCSELDSLRIQLLFSAISSTRGAELVAKAAARVPFIPGDTGVRSESASPSASARLL